MQPRILVVGLGLALAACGGDTKPATVDAGAGAGGTPSSGATTGSGGAPGTGGEGASGGTPGNGGKGGTPGNGGKGGTPGNGGKGGTPGNGGKGGAPGNGGKGGTPGNGGKGGAPGNGGKGGAGGSPNTGGTGGGKGCSPACGTARDCCGDHCANLQNDPQNCGKCGKVCDSGTYCGGGQCVTPPCDATCEGGATCCGSSCCGSGELCCDPQGPLSRGPVCTTPTNGTCPMGCAPLCVCASPETPIATPEGEKAIAALNVGDLVYSVDRGRVVVVPLLRTHHTAVSRHVVMRVRLATSAVLEISARHPTADGRLFGDLRPGDALDGVEVTAASVVPYEHDATYDILPDSDTGAYFAGGVLVGSTLAAQPALVTEPTAPMELQLRGNR